MSKIAIYIVRYRETDKLYKCLDSVKKCGDSSGVPVYVINNYGTLELPDEYKCVTVLNNVTRPDFSTGHLSRNWNQAIINGFQDLNSPRYDKIVAIQADVELADAWYEHVVHLNENIKYLACGRGDEFQIFTPEGVKAVGIYDERFCNIGHQEADYFLRNLLIQRDTCCILDKPHGRFHCPAQFSNVNVEDFIVPSIGCANEDHIKSAVYHDISNRWFSTKWGNTGVVWRDHWNNNDAVRELCPFKKEVMYYPYFEKDIRRDLYVY